METNRQTKFSTAFIVLTIPKTVSHVYIKAIVDPYVKSPLCCRKIYCAKPNSYLFICPFLREMKHQKNQHPTHKERPQTTPASAFEEPVEKTLQLLPYTSSGMAHRHFPAHMLSTKANSPSVSGISA